MWKPPTLIGRGICQIGIVHVRGGEIKDQWQTLVNPEDWFDPWTEELLQIAGRWHRRVTTIDTLLNLIVPSIAERGGRGINVTACPQPVERFPRSRVVGIPLQEFGEQGLGLCATVAQNQQSGHDYV